MAARSTAARESAGCAVECCGRSVQVAERVGRGEGSARAPYSWHLMQRAREGIDHRPERFPRIARLHTTQPAMAAAPPERPAS